MLLLFRTRIHKIFICLPPIQTSPNCQYKVLPAENEKILNLHEIMMIAVDIDQMFILNICCAATQTIRTRSIPGPAAVMTTTPPTTRERAGQLRPPASQPPIMIIMIIMDMSMIMTVPREACCVMK
jgi:hypothetical protein